MKRKKGYQRKAPEGQPEIAVGSKVVRVACRGADTANLADLHPFQGDLKHLSEENYGRLKAAILKYGFSFPFAVWKDGDTLRIEDGHQREKVLKRMAEDGYEIPPLPIDYIEAADEREAKEKILLATSQYGEMDNYSLTGFLEESDLQFPDLEAFVNLPSIDLKYFDDKLGKSEDSGNEQFMIIVTCENEGHQIELLEKFQVEGLQCRAFRLLIE